MTEEELCEVEGRVQRVRDALCMDDTRITAYQIVTRDVPVLCADVRRLRESLAVKTEEDLSEVEVRAIDAAILMMPCEHRRRVAQDVSALCAEVRRLRQENERLRSLATTGRAGALPREGDRAGDEA